MLRLPSSAKPPRQPIEVPTFEEIERITANLPKQVAALAWLGARTGLRPGELLGLDLANIEPFNLPLRTVKEGEPTTGALRVCQQMDCRAHEIVARLKTPKSWRTVKIGAGTVALILEHLAANGRTAAEGGLLFRTLEGNPMAHHYMNKRWAAAVRKAGLRRIRTHDMRHYFASALIEDGASPIFVRDAMGHSRTEETTDTYGHLFPDWDDKVRDTIDTRIARDKASALEAAAEAEK
jgi:integrase